jgi:hypothetical protein
MNKYELYSKNNLNECITSHKESNLGLATLYFRMSKQLPVKEFEKLFEVRKAE